MNYSKAIAINIVSNDEEGKKFIIYIYLSNSYHMRDMISGKYVPTYIFEIYSFPTVFGAGINKCD